MRAIGIGNTFFFLPTARATRRIISTQESLSGPPRPYVLPTVAGSARQRTNAAATSSTWTGDMLTAPVEGRTPV